MKFSWKFLQVKRHFPSESVVADLIFIANSDSMIFPVYPGADEELSHMRVNASPSFVPSRVVGFECFRDLVLMPYNGIIQECRLCCYTGFSPLI